MEQFGNKLKILLNKHKMQSKELSYVLGLSQVYISNLLNGTRKPSLDVIIKIAGYFNIRLDRLINDNVDLETDEYNIKETDLDLIKRICERVLQKRGINQAPALAELIITVFKQIKYDEINEPAALEFVEKMLDLIS